MGDMDHISGGEYLESKGLGGWTRHDVSVNQENAWIDWSKNWVWVENPDHGTSDRGISNGCGWPKRDGRSRNSITGEGNFGGWSPCSVETDWTGRHSLKSQLGSCFRSGVRELELLQPKSWDKVVGENSVTGSQGEGDFGAYLLSLLPLP